MRRSWVQIPYRLLMSSPDMFAQMFGGGCGKPARKLEDVINDMGDIDKLDDIEDFKVGDNVRFFNIGHFGAQLAHLEHEQATIKEIKDGSATFTEQEYKELTPIPVLYIRKVDECDVDLSDW